MLEKIARVRAMIGSRPIHLEVDGGVTPDNAGKCAAAGADVLVAGSAAFKGGKYAENIAAIRAAATKSPDVVIPGFMPGIYRSTHSAQGRPLEEFSWAPLDRGSRGPSEQVQGRAAPG